MKGAQECADAAVQEHRCVRGVAGKAALTILAVDKDFELIAEITGQPVATLDG